MRCWLPMLVAITGCDAAAPALERRHHVDAVTVRQLGGDGAQMGWSLAGCGAFSLVGVPGKNQVFRNTGPMVLPASLAGLGSAVACTPSNDTAV